jgi:hypothetical protein
MIPTATQVNTATREEWGRYVPSMPPLLRVLLSALSQMRRFPAGSCQFILVSLVHLASFAGRGWDDRILEPFVGFDVDMSVRLSVGRWFWRSVTRAWELWWKVFCFLSKRYVRGMDVRHEGIGVGLKGDEAHHLDGGVCRTIILSIMSFHCQICYTDKILLRYI